MEIEELEKARKILGDSAANISDDNLASIIAEMKFLASSWLDDFEREQFDGKTIAELLDENSNIL